MTDDEKELAKITADAMVKPLGNLVERLFGGAVDQIGGEWEDRLKARRQVRRVKLYLKIKAQLDAAGIEPREIPEKIWLPALQAASLEDEETLQDKWAALLANAADPRNLTTILPSFPTILAGLSARDAQFLDALYSALGQSAQKNRIPSLTHLVLQRDQLLSIYVGSGLSRTKHLGALIGYGFSDEKVATDLDLADFGATLATLLSYGLMHERASAKIRNVRPKISERDHNITIDNIETQASYYLSHLAISFVRACQAPSRADK